MTEQQYIEELQQALGKLNEEERKDILRDFREYFENGRAEGKTIEDMIGSLGSAEEIATELLKAYSEEEFVQQNIQLTAPMLPTDFTSVSIESEQVNLLIKASADEKVYTEIEDKDEKADLQVDIVNGVLKIRIMRKKFKLKILSFRFDLGVSSKIVATISLPEALYEKISVKSDIGSISIEQLQTKELELKTDMGSIYMNSMLAANLVAKNDVGNITVEKCNFMNALCKSDTGKVEVKQSTAKFWKLKTDTNRVECNRVIGEVDAKSSVGKVIYNAPTIQYPLNLKTDVGSIKVTTEYQLEDGTITAKSDMGSVSIYGNKGKKFTYGNGTIPVHLKSDIGKIQVVSEIQENLKKSSL